MIKAIHLTTSVSRLAGGLFASVRLLSHSLVQTGRVDLSILGVEDACSAADSPLWAPLDLHLCPVTGPMRLAYAPGMVTELMSRAPDLVHLHGIWQYPSIAVMEWARASDRPYMVSAHGMLEPWSLQNSKWKKRIVSLWFQDRCLRNAKCLRATSDMEVESIRLAGYRNPIANIPNGVEFPEVLPARERGTRRRALFLSRIHPKKGLPNLIRAWEIVRPEGWELAIIGPDECGHLAELKAMVAAAGLQDDVSFPGEAWGDARTSEYRKSELFILPTHSENFGLVIAEALACEVPVITTKGTPWQDLETNECGWWIDIAVDPLVAALRDACRRQPEELEEMGRRGRAMVISKYEWKPIGEQLVEVYGWMLQGGTPPASVVTS